ncbi:MAG TPA: V-type ATP synthase subunit F, partial [Candidatus Binatus sp.]|nr:V-type ATP synthase subunit F [Candidatus Binatus sp.]
LRFAKKTVGQDQEMGKIGIMADKETATYFRLGGIENSWVVNSVEEAVKDFEEIKKQNTVSLVIVTDKVFDWIKDRVDRGKKEIELPLVVSVPTRKGGTGGRPQVDLLAELIKRTVGVEIRVQ